MSIQHSMHETAQNSTNYLHRPDFEEFSKSWTSSSFEWKLSPSSLHFRFEAEGKRAESYSIDQEIGFRLLEKKVLRTISSWTIFLDQEKKTCCVSFVYGSIQFGKSRLANTIHWPISSRERDREKRRVEIAGRSLICLMHSSKDICLYFVQQQHSISIKFQQNQSVFQHRYWPKRSNIQYWYERNINSIVLWKNYLSYYDRLWNLI